MPPSQMSSLTPDTIPIKVEFTGGLELVFSNTRSLTIHLPPYPSSSSSSSAPTISSLITHLTTIPEFDPSRRDHFVLDSASTSTSTSTTSNSKTSSDSTDPSTITVRPGILVLVNDADWALEGEGACVLREGDEVVFVSTLHGG